MSFLWRDYLTVAAALIQARNTFAPAEGRYRAAISRAYYAAYGAARNHARDHEGYSPVSTGRDHGLVAARIADRGVVLAGSSRSSALRNGAAVGTSLGDVQESLLGEEPLLATREDEHRPASAPLTISRANLKVARSKSMKAALDEIAFRQPVLKVPSGSQSALEVLGKERTGL